LPALSLIPNFLVTAAKAMRQMFAVSFNASHHNPLLMALAAQVSA
jgi:hypothetical protein